MPILIDEAYHHFVSEMDRFLVAFKQILPQKAPRQTNLAGQR